MSAATGVERVSTRTTSSYTVTGIKVSVTTMNSKTKELIDRRRRQIHVHSVLYYHHDTNLVADAVYDAWCVELALLQAKHPESKTQGYETDLFSDWTGETGFHLPETDWVLGIAAWLMKAATHARR